MRKKSIAFFWISLVILLSGLSDVEAGRIVTFDRFVGLVSIGGSVFFAREAYDYNQKADDLYEEYKHAMTSARAEDLYDDVTRNDLKSEVHLVLSVCLAINGLRLLLVPGEPELEDLYGEAVLLKHRELAMKLSSDPKEQQIGLVLAKRF